MEAAPSPSMSSLSKTFLILTAALFVSVASLTAQDATMTTPEAAAPAVSLAADYKALTESVKKATDGLDAHTININIVWTLITGFLVMFMQAGFAMVETGFTRAKNCCHTMSMNFMVYALGMLGFWATGFAIMFGGTGAASSVSTVGTLGPEVGAALNSALHFSIAGKEFQLMGTSGWFLFGDQFFTGGIFTLFLFQMVFMDTTATIPTGAMAERWKFFPFCIYAVFVGGFLYPLFGSWVWGGGWLAALGKNFGLGHGHVDFAGSSVVHLCGGAIALAGAQIIGPRYGKFNKNGTSNPIPGHNVPMAMIGTFILAFGWFGFNPGSTLAGTDNQIGIVATNTMLASAAGAAMGMIITWLRFGKPDPSFMCNGMLAGLVAITAPCAFVDAWAAVVIGAIAGVIVLYSALFVEEVLKVDDPVGAISVHGANGAWGVLSLGLFANNKYGAGWNGVEGNVKGLFWGDASQLVAQCIGTLTCIVSVYVIAYIFFSIVEKTIGNRTEVVDEIAGLDIPEMGALGYQADINPESR